MKQFTLLTILLCLLVSITRAATVSGMVTYTGTSTPVAGQMIYVTDSFRTFTLTDTTSVAGYYSITVPGSVPTGTVLLVSTMSCGAIQLNTHTYTGSSIASNFSVCSSTGGSYTIHGAISLGSTANNGPAMVYLISKQYDRILMDTTLDAIDSFLTSSTGGSYSGTVSGSVLANASELLLKVALLPSHPSYSSFLPTYYTSSLNWSGATPLDTNNFTPAVSTNITMIGGTNPGGPGFIGGSVLLGANKPGAVGDPLSKRILLLTTMSGQAVAYTYSDANGKFSFPSLAYGSYKLFGDALGKSNPPLTVTISQASPGTNGIVFEENSSSFQGHLNGLSVAHTQGSISAVQVYPNPVTDVIQFTGLNNIMGNKSIVLHDATGAIKIKQELRGNQPAQLSVSELPAGLYVVQIITESGSITLKITK